MCGWCHCQEHGQGQQFKMGSRRKEVTPKPVEEEELEEVEVEEED